MSVFESTRTVPVAVADLTPVAEQMMEHFRAQGYEVTGEPSVLHGWHVSLHKGGLFQAAVGTKTALNITIEPNGGETKCHAGVGVFGEQAVPTVISMLVFWPVLVTQVWGLVKQSKLDDEALDVIETLLRENAEHSKDGAFCTQCGARMAAHAKFCPECGAKQPA